MYPDELVVIGVHSAKFSSEKLTQNIRQAVMRYGIEHPVVNDAGFKIWDSYAVRAWPTLVLIDPQGRIAGETSGEILAEDLAGEINDLIRRSAGEINRVPLNLPLESESEPARPLSYPARLLVSGNTLFISDTGHHRIVQVHLDENGQSGTVERVLGSGEEGLRDGPAETAAFNRPHGLGLRGDPQTGTLFVADTENHAVRAIDLQTGQIRTLAGTGQKAHGRQLRSPNPLEIPLRSPWAVLPVEQYLFIAMAGSHQIWVMIGEDRIGPFAGTGAEALVDGPLGEASFNQPSDLSFGVGYLFVADAEASAIRAISLADSPQVTTLVGQGLFDWGDQDGTTRTALLQHPTGLAIANQDLYVADTYNHKIKRIEPLKGVVSSLVGSGQAGFKDGPFEQASMYEPHGIAEKNRLLYIADTNNHVIRVANTRTRTLSTLVLKKLERLSPLVGENRVIQLPPVATLPGKVQMRLLVRLPAGYEINPDTLTTLQVGDQSGCSKQTLEFQPGQDIAWVVDLHDDTVLAVDITLYYCQADHNGLCFIHDRRLQIPVQVGVSKQEEIIIPYVIDPPEVAG